MEYQNQKVAGSGHPERRANPSHTAPWNTQVKPQLLPGTGFTFQVTLTSVFPKLPPSHKTTNTKLTSPSSESHQQVRFPTGQRLEETLWRMLSPPHCVLSPLPSPNYPPPFTPLPVFPLRYSVTTGNYSFPKRKKRNTVNTD